MRVSSDVGDPGFTSDAGAFEILIDGVEAEVCAHGRVIITADSDTGEIRYYFRFPNGDFHKDGFGDFTVHTARAAVVINPPSWYRHVQTDAEKQAARIPAADDVATIARRLKEIEAEVQANLEPLPSPPD